LILGKVKIKDKVKVGKMEIILGKVKMLKIDDVKKVGMLKIEIR